MATGRRSNETRRVRRAPKGAGGKLIQAVQDFRFGHACHIWGALR
jgi:hypothetical protein